MPAVVCQAMSHHDELIEVRVRQSWRFTLLFLIGHGVALIAPWLSSLPMAAKLVANLLLILHGFRFARLYLLRDHPDSILAVRFRSGQWYVQRRAGWVRGWVAGQCLVTSELMTFRFRLEGQRRHCFLCLFSDSDREEALHALRLRILLEGPG